MRNDFKVYENLVLLTQIGLIMMIPIFAGVYIGNWIDKQLNTGSIFLLIFVLVGVASAFMNFYKFTMKKFPNKNKKNKK